MVEISSLTATTGKGKLAWEDRLVSLCGKQQDITCTQLPIKSETSEVSLVVTALTVSTVSMVACKDRVAMRNNKMLVCNVM